MGNRDAGEACRYLVISALYQKGRTLICAGAVLHMHNEATLTQTLEGDCENTFRGIEGGVIKATVSER